MNKRLKWGGVARKGKAAYSLGDNHQHSYSNVITSLSHDLTVRASSQSLIIWFGKGLYPVMLLMFIVFKDFTFPLIWYSIFSHIVFVQVTQPPQFFRS